MAHHRRYLKIRVGPEPLSRVYSDLWNDRGRIRRMKGVKRRQAIRKLRAFIARLLDPNDPFGKRKYPSRSERH